MPGAAFERAISPLLLVIKASGGELLMNDADLAAAGAAQPGGFRAELVQTLGALRPGYLRDWQGQLADSPANRLARPLARAPIRYRPGDHELQFAYSLPEFLELCAAVQARPWVVLPATSTPSQAREFVAALAAAWRRHGFDEIVVEHGNEHWNAVFRPAGIADAGRPAQVADRTFAALAPQRGRAGGATFFHYRQEAGESPAALLQRLLHEGIAPLPQSLAELRALGRDLDVYEANFHTTLGDAAPDERDAVMLAPAAGTVLARRLLHAASLGVRRQAVYILAPRRTATTAAGRERGADPALPVRPGRVRAAGAIMVGRRAHWVTRACASRTLRGKSRATPGLARPIGASECSNFDSWLLPACG